MKHFSLMIKPASALCNLRCQYCFYADVAASRQVLSYGIMDDPTATAVVANLFAAVEEGDAVTIAFQGGEPTLAGLSYFRHFVRQVQARKGNVRVSYALQTNGMALDEEWCAFLARNNFLVGLSLDGYAEIHNRFRLDANGKGTFAPVLAAKHLMDRTGVEYNVLCTLTNELARHPQKVWSFILDENVQYIQFTPCLGKLESGEDPWALRPQRFHSFYTGLFPFWKEALCNNRYISVKLFDDIVNLFVRREVTSCGLDGRCQMQHVVEGDGSVFPCDFYVLDEYSGGNLARLTWREADEQLVATGFLNSRKHLPGACTGCRYLVVCQGGCKRMEKAMYVDETGFCGYRSLLDDIGEELCGIGARLLAADGRARG